MNTPSARQKVITKLKCSGHQVGAIAQAANMPMAATAPSTARMSPPRPLPGASKALRATLISESGLVGEGGTCTYFLRPLQKITVAMNMRMPGMPKAHAGPHEVRKIGISKDAKNEPKLIVQ